MVGKHTLYTEDEISLLKHMATKYDKSDKKRPTTAPKVEEKKKRSLVDILLAHKLFKGFDETTLKQILLTHEVKNYNDKDKIIKINQSEKKIYMILNGIVDVKVYLEDRELIKNRLKQYSCLNLAEYTLSKPIQYDFISNKSAKILSFTLNEDILQKNSKLYTQYLKNIIEVIS